METNSENDIDINSNETNINKSVSINNHCSVTNCNGRIYKSSIYCYKCYLDNNTSNRLAKERHMISYIRDNISEIKWITGNKIINEFGYVVDIYAEFDKYILLIECDEYQHKKYYNEYDRIMNIYNNISKHIVIIRFNPDDYILFGKRINSCWYKKSGIVECTDKIYKRYELLCECIRKYSSLDYNESSFVNSYPRKIQTIYICYDIGRTQIKNIDIEEYSILINGHKYEYSEYINKYMRNNEVVTNKYRLDDNKKLDDCNNKQYEDNDIEDILED